VDTLSAGMAGNDARITFRLPAELAAALRATAALHGRSLNVEAREAVRAHVLAAALDESPVARNGAFDRAPLGAAADGTER
jgi:plasmid stability protein